MEKLVACVPNFSEGRDAAVIEAVVAAARGVPGVTVLHVEADRDHHRTVLTFVGPPGAAAEGAFQVAREACARIDLNRHKGEHPRIGAVDVIPFIPLLGASMEDCAQLAAGLGHRIGRELKVPVYLYGQAARSPARRDLVKVRKGEFEGLREALGRDPDRDPDFGPKAVHPTAGAVAVGARDHIVNLNVNLATQDMALAERTARAVRESGGGLAAVRAKAIDLAERGLVQISTVLTDYKITGIQKVLSAIKEISKTPVESVEIVGLVPRAALLDYTQDALNLINFRPERQILEAVLMERFAWGTRWQGAARRLVEAVAEPTSTPGGGSVSAVAGAMGCGLGRMVAGISARSYEKRLKQDPSAQERLDAVRRLDGELGELSSRLTSGMDADASAFEAVMAAYRLPKDDPRRRARLQEGLKGAAAVPLETARTAVAALRKLDELERWALDWVSSDIRVARSMLRAAVDGAIENVLVNLGEMEDAVYAQEARRQIAEIRDSLAPPAPAPGA